MAFYIELWTYNDSEGTEKNWKLMMEVQTKKSAEQWRDTYENVGLKVHILDDSMKVIYETPKGEGICESKT